MSYLKLKKLRVEKAPGMPNGIPEFTCDQGISVILGPNASGKSTAARVIRAFLWDKERTSRDKAEATWDLAGQQYECTIFAGQTSWTPPMSALPDEKVIPPGIARLGLRDLLEPHGDHEKSFAAIISRGLAGGLDLGQLRTQLRVPESISRQSSVAKEWKEARANLRDAERSIDGVAELEKKIPEIEQRIERIGQLVTEEKRTKSLKDYLQACANADESEKKGGNFPAGMELIQDGMDEERQDLEKQEGDAREALKHTQNEIHRLEHKDKENSFPNDPPEPRVLGEWAAKLERLKGFDDEIVELETALAGATEKRDEAQLAQGKETPKDTTPPTPKKLLEVQQVIESLRQERAREKALCSELEAYEARAEIPEQETEQIHRELRLLRSWLRAPSAGIPLPGLARWLVAAGITALFFGAFAIAIGIPNEVSGIALCLLGAALLAFRVFLFPGKESNSSAERTQIERDLSSRTSSLIDWKPDSIEIRIEKLEALSSKVKDAELAVELANHTRPKHQDVLKKIGQLEEELTEELRQHGLPSNWGDLQAAEQMRRLKDLHDAELHLADLRGKLDRTNELAEKRRSDWWTWFEKYDRENVPRSTEPQTLLTEIQDRFDAYSSAKDDLQSLEEKQVNQAKHTADAEARLRAFWTRLKLADHSDPKSEFLRRMNALNRYKKHQDESIKIHAQREIRKNEYEEVGQPSRLCGRDPSEISISEVDNWMNQIEEERISAGDPSEDLGGAKQQLEAARDSHAMPDAIARLAQAEAQVATQRDTAIEHALARLVLDDACDRHQSDHVPEILENARETFYAFTHHRWQLHVDTDEVFWLKDSWNDETDVSAQLEDLSDGTRVQLLLALRLAYLKSIGKGTPTLPLTIDEALSNADPIRFEAVATALFALADSGQQIFYLTANHGEVEQWRAVANKIDHAAPNVIDLSALSGKPTDWGPGLPASPQPIQSIPAPDGLTPEAYAKKLLVSPLHHASRPASWHLYYASHTELQALHNALTQGIQTIGQWQNIRAQSKSIPGITEDSAQEIDSFASLTLSVASQWSVGRGRRVEWDDIEKSGAKSKNWEKHVRKIFEETDGDSAAFIQEVENNSKGFHGTTKQNLRTHLELTGVLATVAPLTREDIVPRALGNAADACKRLGAPQARAHVEWLLDLLTSSAT
jgi:DNA repair protein SbcC/Rad50